ncbi:unnamed protein product [Haemonchus placei]|uniref:C2H2-type domain-containing protein n=1 Tax=Haemonchus placei TaxID=6290 RepID=A0A0N4WSY2_HAEPC|nr:unnamed protein product [Haemonchus placei]
MEGTAAKKARVWNPALDNDVIKDKLNSDHDQTSNNTPIDFSRATNPSLPLLIQLMFTLAAPLLPSSSSSSSAAPTTISNNPLVQSALGVVAMTNENCCAICGSAFRLTADLVQHMRNNHRRTRFKRKNEKTFV